MSKPGPQNAVFANDPAGPAWADEDGESRRAEALAELATVAKFSRTKEFKRLEEHINARIEYYQTHIPDGRPLSKVPPEHLGPLWIAANVIVGELKGILTEYELARETVKNAR